MSFFEIVMPASVALWKPSVLIVSSTAASTGEPNRSTRSAMKSSSSFFAIVRFMYGQAAVVSSRTSAIERTISSLKITRPGVVRISSPCRRYSMVSWSRPGPTRAPARPLPHTRNASAGGRASSRRRMTGPAPAVGEEVQASDHVLGRRGQRPPMRRREDVVRGQHQHAGLGLCLR